MPPRLESELDPVTLHNMALLTADANPSESFDKLQFLLLQQVAQQQQQLENSEARLTGAGPLVCPPETFANLLLLYCKYEYFDLAADLMAEHADLTYKHLSPVSNNFVSWWLYLFIYLFSCLVCIRFPGGSHHSANIAGRSFCQVWRPLRSIRGNSSANGDQFERSSTTAEFSYYQCCRTCAWTSIGNVIIFLYSYLRTNF